MVVYWIVVLMGLALGGCEDHGSEHDAHDAATVDNMQLFEQLIAETYAQWDRGHMATCVCAAEIGAYKSAEECFELLRSGPDWASCSAMAVADLNSPELRERTRCLTKLWGARNDCYDNTACGTDERAACESIMLECAVFDASITLTISQKCPDTTILARLND